VNGVKLTAIITYITLIAVGQTVGALVWGALADWAVRKGLSAASVFVGAVALCVCIQLAAVGGIALPSSIVWGVLVAGAAAMLPFVVLLTHFPQAYAARACASIGVLQYVATFSSSRPLVASSRYGRIGIRSNVSDRLCDGIHGADRIATRCSGLVLVSSIGNTRRRAERRGSRCCV
jgi:MFS family permease